MTTQTEALKLALEALDYPHWREDMWLPKRDSAITAIKEALAQPELCKYGQEPKSCTSSPMDCQCALDATFAQPEQEPVGQLLEEAYGRGQVMWFNKPDDFSMLYTTPPQRTWVGLTYEEQEEIVANSYSIRDCVTKTAVKLKEKNT